MLAAFLANLGPIESFGLGCAAVILVGVPLVWLADRLERWADERAKR